MIKYNKEYKFESGVMWEKNPFYIFTNCECSKYGGEPCKHCFDFKDIIHTRSDGTTFTEKTWINPAVIVVHNEGGCNSTGVCVNCVKEALNSLNI